jgi:hypothetical protein
MAQTLAMPAVFDPQSPGPVQVLEHQTLFAQAPDAQAAFAVQGSPTSPAPDGEVPELAALPELPEPVPEVAELPELLLAAPEHSDAQFASTHANAAFASEFWDCSTHDWQDDGHPPVGTQLRSIAAQAESPWHARAASQHFCAKHTAHGEVEEVVHWFAPDPLLAVAPVLEPETPLEPAAASPPEAAVDPDAPFDPAPPAFPTPDRPPRIPGPPPPPELELQPMAAEPNARKNTLARPNLVFTFNILLDLREHPQLRKTAPRDLRHNGFTFTLRAIAQSSLVQAEMPASSSIHVSPLTTAGRHLTVARRLKTHFRRLSRRRRTSCGDAPISRATFKR